jgi:hypothetical protein
MTVIEPFWFKQRQCKAEALGEHALRVSGPNLGEAILEIRPEGNRYRAALRKSAEGPDLAVTEPEMETPQEAWEAAFELYRTHFIV